MFETRSSNTEGYIKYVKINILEVVNIIFKPMSILSSKTFLGFSKYIIFLHNY